jgi:hypothetical protein
LWSRHPAWSADQVRTALLKAARAAAAKHSSEVGYGMVQLPEVGR